MDHNEVRELLEDAAVEPGGLERLMAGDTPNAALVAGHLAGCAECAGGDGAAPPIGRHDPAGRPGRAAARAPRADAGLRGGPRSPPWRATLSRARRTSRPRRPRSTVRPVALGSAPPAAVRAAAGDGRRAGPRRRRHGPRRQREPRHGRPRPGRGDRGPRRRRSLDARRRRPARRRSGSSWRARTATGPTRRCSISPKTSELVVVAEQLVLRRPARNTAAGSRSAAQRKPIGQDVLRRRSRLLGRRRPRGRRTRRRARGSACRSSISPVTGSTSRRHSPWPRPARARAAASPVVARARRRAATRTSGAAASGSATRLGASSARLVRRGRRQIRGVQIEDVGDGIVVDGATGPSAAASAIQRASLARSRLGHVGLAA